MGKSLSFSITLFLLYVTLNNVLSTDKDINYYEDYGTGYAFLVPLRRCAKFL